MGKVVPKETDREYPGMKLIEKSIFPSEVSEVDTGGRISSDLAPLSGELPKAEGVAQAV